MQVETLFAINALLFFLYAGIMLVISRIFGNVRPSAWFSASCLCRAGAMLILLPRGAFVTSPFAQAASCILTVLGLLMLHRSFAELLDRARLLWRLQLILVLLVAAVTLYLAFVPSRYSASLLMVSAIQGVQVALTASALFSFAGGEGVVTAGWFTGITLSVYALLQLMQTSVTLRFGSLSYPNAAREMGIVTEAGCLLANAAIAFGFVSIAAAKLRLELLWRAQIDELTGLLNRWAFKRIATKETLRSMRSRGRLAVVMMDLDGMKSVNDRMGHGGGDAVLQGVSNVLQEAVRDRDSIARMGGDEFCILLPDTHLAEAITVAERLRFRVESLNVRYRGENIRIRASFGVSSSEHIGWDWQELVDRSDDALYRAKRAGNNQVVAAAPPAKSTAVIERLDAGGVHEERRKR